MTPYLMTSRLFSGSVYLAVSDLRLEFKVSSSWLFVLAVTLLLRSFAYFSLTKLSFGFLMGVVSRGKRFFSVLTPFMYPSTTTKPG